MLGILILKPYAGLASQGSEADSAYVLAIEQFFLDDAQMVVASKFRYLAAGAVVDLETKDDRTFKDARITKIERDKILLEKEVLAISDIEHLQIGKKSKRTGSKILGSFGQVFGIITGIGWVATLVNILSDDPGGGYWLIAITAFPIWMIVAGRSLLKKYRKYDFSQKKYALGTASVNELSAKLQKKLNRKFYAK